MTDPNTCVCGHLASDHHGPVHPCYRCPCDGFSSEEPHAATWRTSASQSDIKRRKAGKIRVDLVPPGVDEAIAAVMSQVLGLDLKCEDDWHILLNDPPLDVERMLAAAAKRHANAVLAGEEYDEETGLPHVQCILAGASIWNAILYQREAVARLASRGTHYHATREPEPAPLPPPPLGPCPPQENTWTSDLQEDRPSWLDTASGQEATGEYFKAADKHVRFAIHYGKAVTNGDVRGGCRCANNILCDCDLPYAGGPPYNHTGGDSALTPCDICRRLQELEADKDRK